MTRQLGTPTDITSFVRQFADLSDPELILLKAHLLVERILSEALAFRLDRSPEERAPRVGFGTLIELAVRNDPDRAPLRCFNDIRNALAHELAGTHSAAFQGAVRKLGVTWPDSRELQADTCRLVGHWLIARAFLHYLHEEHELARRQPDAEFVLDMEDIKQKDAQLNELRKSIAKLETHLKAAPTSSSA